MSGHLISHSLLEYSPCSLPQLMRVTQCVVTSPGSFFTISKEDGIEEDVLIKSNEDLVSVRSRVVVVKALWRGNCSA